MDDNTSINRPWFKRKIFGWGWLPSAWQGWVLTLVFILIITLSSNAFGRGPAFWLIVIVAAILFILMAKKKGEKPKRGSEDSREKPEEKYKKYY